MNKAERLGVLTRLRENNLRPTTGLSFSLPFELLIAVLLSTQTTDVSVDKATAKLHSAVNTPATVLELGIEGVKAYIKTIGLYNNKAGNTVKTCRTLLGQHSDEVPEDRVALEAPPDVGRRTADVVLNTAFGWSTIAVDTHVFHVCNRTQLVPGKNVEQVKEKLLKVVPAESKVDCHRWLILRGRYTYITRKSRCGSCIIEDLCEYKEEVDVWGSGVALITPFTTFPYPLLKHLFNANDAIVQRYHQIIRL